MARVPMDAELRYKILLHFIEENTFIHTDTIVWAEYLTIDDSYYVLEEFESPFLFAVKNGFENVVRAFLVHKGDANATKKVQ